MFTVVHDQKQREVKHAKHSEPPSLPLVSLEVDYRGLRVALGGGLGVDLGVSWGGARLGRGLEAVTG
eukprot:1042999-Amorphochlora_amoeboformis.AAC.1